MTTTRSWWAGLQLAGLRIFCVTLIALRSFFTRTRMSHQNGIVARGKVRIVYVLGPEFEEYEGDAMWEDAKLGMHHMFDFERVGVVTDVTDPASVEALADARLHVLRNVDHHATPKDFGFIDATQIGRAHV